MSFLTSISRLVQDPPPSHLFELSEAGLAFAYNGQNGFQPFEPGTLVASPVEDNLLRPDAIAAAIERVAPPDGSKKRRAAALILPDYAARVTVLDFDSFPTSPEEQVNLVRFRVKKTIPFDVDSSAVSYHVQPASGGKKVDVVAVIMALEVIARYEALFRRAGFHPGLVTISSMAALNLYEGQDVSVLAKLANRVLSVAVLVGSNIKLFRCVALEEATQEEVQAVLQPTFAYVEDELGTPARRLVLCGLPLGAAADLDCETRPLRGRYVSPGPFNAGLLGYLEGMEG